MKFNLHVFTQSFSNRPLILVWGTQNGKSNTAILWFWSSIVSKIIKVILMSQMILLKCAI